MQVDKKKQKLYGCMYLIYSPCRSLQESYDHIHIPAAPNTTQQNSKNNEAKKYITKISNEMP